MFCCAVKKLLANARQFTMYFFLYATV